ncbi:MAG: ROK family protein [Anaerolineae bacterium]
MEAKPLYGGIEAGGTKFICAIGRGPDDIQAEERFLTTSPEETIGRAIAFFRRWQEAGGPALSAIGIASFGPLDPDPDSPTFGYITVTPKPGWAHTEFAGVIQRALHLPVAFDTDVNGAALAEWLWGAGQGLHTLVYLTIGTGIGGGAVVHGQLLHGLTHPEMGHMHIPHDPRRDPFPGACLYHGDCLEGLAAGPALKARWGQPAENLPPDHPAWELEAEYLALGVMNLAYTLAPQRVILGGGVMAQVHLFPRIRQKLTQLLNGYIPNPVLLEDMERYIVPPALGARAGVLGAIALAQKAHLPGGK